MRKAHLKDHFLETRLFTTRAVVAVVILVLMTCGLIARLYWLQVLNHDLYITQSEDNRVKIVALPPTRGLIYDRNGVLLAENLTSFHLEIVPEQVEDMDDTLAALGRIVSLSDDDLQRFRKTVKRTRRFDGVPLRFNLSEEEVAAFSIVRHRFPGVDIVARLTRHYPLEHLAAHVVGYVGRIDEEELQNIDAAQYSGTSYIGKVGIEKQYENLLHGEVGYHQVETNAQGRVLRVLKFTPPTPGKNLVLSIDARLQAIAEAALGDFNGAAVAIDPNTGAVLAQVSKPGFDPDPFVNGIDHASYNALQQDEARPLYNRALTGRYPPGSTLKPFVAMAGLIEGVTTPDHTTWCPGYFTLPGVARKYRCWKRTGHGTVNMHSAITESCDVYFYELAQSLGIDRLHRALSQFGFGARSGIDNTGEAEGLLPSREWKRRVRRQTWYPGETIITGIGQGYTLSTPLQLAVATATLAMRGQRYTPQTLMTIQDPNADTEENLQPKPAGHIEAAPQYWQEVIDAMTEVVHGPHGTARRIGADAPYRIAGKTGTAQVFGLKQDQKYKAEDIDVKLRDHALFIAFAPVEAPRIAVAVFVENGGGGGAVAAPIARQIMDQYLLD